MGKVVAFPDAPDKQDRMLCMMIWIPLGQLSQRLATVRGEELSSEVMDAIEDIADAEGSWWVSDIVDVQ